MKEGNTYQGCCMSRQEDCSESFEINFCVPSCQCPFNRKISSFFIRERHLFPDSLHREAERQPVSAVRADQGCGQASCTATLP
jgi:hypothetical protein